MNPKKMNPRDYPSIRPACKDCHLYGAAFPVFICAHVCESILLRRPFIPVNF